MKIEFEFISEFLKNWNKVKLPTEGLWVNSTPTINTHTIFSLGIKAPNIKDEITFTIFDLKTNIVLITSERSGYSSVHLIDFFRIGISPSVMVTQNIQIRLIVLYENRSEIFEKFIEHSTVAQGVLCRNHISSQD